MEKKEKKKPSRVSSGNKSFDKLIEGGFEEHSVNVLVGGLGSGKTIFGSEFLVGGVEKGENVLYISFEETKEEFYENMNSFGWDLEKYEKSGHFTFLEYSPEKVKLMLEEGGGMIESIVYRKKITRMMIDSISSFMLLFETLSQKRQAIVSLFDQLKKWETTIILTIEKDPIKKADISTAAELHADSILIFYNLSVKGKRKRFFEILKMRGTDHSKETYEFEITDDGIVLKKPSDIKELL